jgi:hypothetical protein
MFKGLHPVKYLAGGEAISLKQIVPNPFQPKINRSTPEKIEDLYGTIINSRYMSAIEVVEIPNTTAAREAWEMTLEEYPTHDPAGKEITYYGHLNGDRRCTVADVLDLGAVDVAVVDLPEADRSNPAAMIVCFMQRQSSMSVDAAQQLAIYCKAKSNEQREALLGALKQEVKKSIETLVEYMGLEYTNEKGAKGEVNPHIARDAKAFLKMCKKYGHEAAIAETGLDISSEAQEKIAVTKTIDWVIECGTKRVVDEVVRRHKSDETLVVNVFRSAKRMMGCELKTGNDGRVFLVDRPNKSASSKANTPVNTRNMRTLFNN